MITYRKATIDDADMLAQIRVVFLAEANDVKEQDEKDILHHNNKRFMLESFVDNSFAAWVAESDEEIVATSGISFYRLPPNKSCPSGNVAYISNMFTYPQYRKQGIATKLFALSVDEAKQRGCTKISLNATDMGRSIYEKYGFKDVEHDMIYHVTDAAGNAADPLKNRA